MEGVHVKVQLGTETYAFPVESVLEVAELDGLAAVPGTRPGVLGVRNFHGQVLPVFDLADVLGLPQGELAPRLIVVDHRGCLAGFAVDEVTDVAPITGRLDAAESAYLTHAVLEDGRLVGLVDVDGVFESLARESA
jgi:chemotaxis signal transduction protein